MAPGLSRVLLEVPVCLLHVLLRIRVVIRAERPAEISERVTMGLKLVFFAVKYMGYDSTGFSFFVVDNKGLSLTAD